MKLNNLELLKSSNLEDNNLCNLKIRQTHKKKRFNTFWDKITKSQSKNNTNVYSTIKKNNATAAKNYRLKLNKNKETKDIKNALIANLDFNEDVINVHYMGEINVRCQFCNAKHFIQEKLQDKTFKFCCHKGKIILDDIEEFDQIKQLALGNDKKNKLFKNKSRELNNLLAFASFGAKFIPFKSRGPQVFKICGQVYHNTYSLNPVNDNDYKYGQLYIFDNKTANDFRLCGQETDLMFKSLLDE